MDYVNAVCEEYHIADSGDTNFHYSDDRKFKDGFSLILNQIGFQCDALSSVSDWPILSNGARIDIWPIRD